jgi:DNA repair protein RadC
MRCPPRLPTCLLADHILSRFLPLRRLRARSAGHLSRFRSAGGARLGC